MMIKYSPGFEKSLRKYNKDLRLKTKKMFAPRRNSLRIPQGKDYPGEKNKEKSFHGAGANSKTNEYLDLAIGACEFILKELALFEDDEKLCFGYIPGEQARVHNANMLGAALLARVYSHTKHPDYYGNEGQSPLFLGLEGRGQRAGVRSKLVESLNR
jgi:hypothetical protein